MRSLRSVLRDEKGVAMIMVAFALVMIFGFAALAIDLSLMQLARVQLHNAADAGSLAGAMALALSTGDEAGATADAIAEAIRVAGLNVAVQDSQRPVVINDADVIVEYDLGKVTVNTHRTDSTGDPVKLYFLKVLDPVVKNEGNMTASATAQVTPISGTSCLKPWCIPDKWADADSDDTWDPGEFYDPYVTGYKVPDDIGVRVTLRPAKGSKWEPEWYFAVCFPPRNTGDPLTGTDVYREWITGCEPYMVRIGDELLIEPGDMGVNTCNKVNELIDLDDGAQWDPVTNTVINSAYPVSPRVIKVSAFDPTIGVQDAGPGGKYVTVSKIFVLFMEERCEGKQIVGRFMKSVTEGEPCPGCPEGFLSTVVLVK